MSALQPTCTIRGTLIVPQSLRCDVLGRVCARSSMRANGGEPCHDACEHSPSILRQHSEGKSPPSPLELACQHALSTPPPASSPSGHFLLIHPHLLHRASVEVHPALHLSNAFDRVSFFEVCDTVAGGLA